MLGRGLENDCSVFTSDKSSQGLAEMTGAVFVSQVMRNGEAVTVGGDQGVVIIILNIFSHN